MSTFFYERTPFDILVRNFFQDAGTYLPLAETKVPHPVDIYTNDSGLTFEIAATGIAKEDLEIQIQNNILRVNFDKNNASGCGCTGDDCSYIHQGIAKRSFNLGWKIDSKFNLSKANAEFNNGLLTVTIPFAKGSELKTLKIS